MPRQARHADASRDLTAKLVKLVQAMQEIKAEEDSRVNSYEIFVNQKQTHIRNSRGVDRHLLRL